MAISEIEKLEARWAENPDGRYFAPLADAYRKSGQVDRALELLASGLAKHPDYLSAHIVLGRCQLDRKDDGAARAAFEAVLGLDGENIIALKSLAEISERGGDPLSARRWLQRLLAVDAMNEDAVADLQRLGGPVADGDAPAAEVAEPAAEGVGFSFADVLPSTEAPAPEAAPAELAAPLAVSAIEEMAEAETVPIPAINLPEELAPAPPAAPFAFEPPSGPTVESPFVLEPTAAPAPVFDEPPPRLHEFESAAFEAPAEAVPLNPELEPMAFEPPAAGPVSIAPVEGVTDFDDALGWGVGERMSHAIRAEDIAAAEAAHEQTAIPIEFVEPVTDVSFDGPAPSEGLELPARSTGAIEFDMTAFEPPVEPPVEPPSVAPEPEPAEESLPAATVDLPLILPEEVTPPEEMARPSGKQMRVAEVEEAAPEPVPAEPMLTETMADLYLRQGFKEQAADVYRRLLAQRPGDAGLQAKLAALEAPPSLSAARLGSESVGSFLRRIARAALPVASPEPAPTPDAAPSPMEQAFAEPAPAASVEVTDPVASTPVPGAAARPATDAFSLDQIFGAGATAAAPAAEPAPPPPASLGASFDEFFGAAPAPQESVRPRNGENQRPSSDDLSAFTAWLHGLKR